MKTRMGAKDLVELGRVKCGRGEILRSGYRRKDGVRVKAACVPDKGAPGKAPKGRRWLPKLEPGALGGWRKDEPASTRRSKLKALLRKEPCVTVLRKVNAVANVTTDRPTERKLRKDYRWLRKQGACRLKEKGE